MPGLERPSGLNPKRLIGEIVEVAVSAILLSIGLVAGVTVLILSGLAA